MNQQKQTENQNKNSEKILNNNKQKYKFYADYLNKLIVVLIIISSILSVLSINNLSIQGFIINDKKKKLQAFKIDNQNKEVKITDLESFGNIKKRAEGLRMVKVDGIEYVTVIGGAVAKK